jgi:hypothetical protein
MKHGLSALRAQPQAPTMWFAYLMTQILSCLDEAEIMSWVTCDWVVCERGMGLVDERCVRILEYFHSGKWSHGMMGVAVLDR